MSPTSCHCSTPRCIVSIQIYLPLGKARARATPCIFYNPTYTHLRAPAISLSPDRCCRVAKLRRLHHAPPDNIPRTHAHPLLHSWRNGYPAKAHSLEKADRRSGSPRPGRHENVKDTQGRVRPLHAGAQSVTMSRTSPLKRPSEAQHVHRSTASVPAPTTWSRDGARPQRSQ